MWLTLHLLLSNILSAGFPRIRVTASAYILQSVVCVGVLPCEWWQPFRTELLHIPLKHPWVSPWLSRVCSQMRSAGLAPGIDFSWFDKAYGSCWFSWWKKSSMSASGLAFWIVSWWAPCLTLLILIPWHPSWNQHVYCMYVYVYSFTLVIISDKGLTAVFISFVTNSLNRVWPMIWASLSQL